jgi:hypothetical protein
MLARTRADRSRRKRVREAARSLWANLCEAHALSFTERRLMKRAAQELGFATPAILFFRPGGLAAYLEQRGGSLPEPRRDQLKRLAKILFADTTPRTLADRSAVGDDGLPRRFAPGEVSL